MTAAVLPRCYPGWIRGGKAMPKTRITKRTVDALEAGTAEFVLWDTDLAGFGVRVRPTGAKSYVVQYRAGGRNAPARKITLGTVAKLTAEEARTEAKRILAGAELGKDEAADRAKARAAMSVGELCILYLEEGTDHLKPRSRENVASHIANHIRPILGQRRVSDLSGADIEALQRAVAGGKTAKREPSERKRGVHHVTGGRTVAGAVVRSLSSIMSFAVARKIRADNPASGVRKFKPAARERYLSPDELARLGDAIREAETEGIETASPSRSKHAPKTRRVAIGPHAAAALRLLVLTGARLREVLHLRWSEVDLDSGILQLADSKTGRKTLILNAPAVATLSALPRIGSYVIAGDTAGQRDEKPRSDLKRPWALVTKRAGLDGLRIHDLRHTHASFGAASGLGLPIIGKLLGHTQAATTARYAHLADDPLRKAAERIGADLARAMGEAPAGGAVVPIKGGAMMGGRGSGGRRRGAGRPANADGWLRIRIGARCEELHREAAQQNVDLKLLGDAVYREIIENQQNASDEAIIREVAKERHIEVRAWIRNFYRLFHDDMTKSGWLEIDTTDRRLKRINRALERKASQHPDGGFIWDAIEALASNRRLLEGVSGGRPKRNRAPSGRRFARTRPKNTRKMISSQVATQFSKSEGYVITAEYVEYLWEQYRSEFISTPDDV